VINQIFGVMQGRKIFEDEKVLLFSLSAHVPEHNFYRQLKQGLNLNFLYELTQEYYGRCGQQSIDPVVFFKLCLVGYLENIISDRRLIEHCSMRLDLLYFLGYQIDEPLPWHSTVSRTRQLYPEALFESLFEKVFSLCVEKGMVAGHIQAIDSAPVKANASMDSLLLKQPAESLKMHLTKVNTENGQASAEPGKNNSRKTEQIISAPEHQLRSLLDYFRLKGKYSVKRRNDYPSSGKELLSGLLLFVKRTKGPFRVLTRVWPFSFLSRALGRISWGGK
jgi:transposase